MRFVIIGLLLPPRHRLGQVDGAGVIGLADDGPVLAPAAFRAWMSSRDETPPEAMMSMPNTARPSACRAPRLVPRMAPSREMSVQMMVCTPRACIRSKKTCQVSWLSLQPALDGDLAVLQVRPHGDLGSPYSAHGLGGEVRVGDGGGAENDPARARVQIAARPSPCSRMPPPTSTNRPVWAAMRWMVGRLVVWPRLGPLQVHEMEMGGPGGFKLFHGVQAGSGS